MTEKYTPREHDPKHPYVARFVGCGRIAGGAMICTHGHLARQCELCDRDREIAQLRAAAEEARRVLSMPLLMEGDAPVVQALKMLDEALGTNSDNTKVT